MVTGLESAGGTFRNKAGGKIGRAKSHHGRTRGKDAIADAANAMLDKVIEGIEDGVKKTAKHLDDNMTRGVKQMAKNHHDNDKSLADHFNSLGKEGGKDPKPPNGGSSGTGGSGGGASPKPKGPQSKGPSKSEASKQADADHPHDKTRKDDGKCTDGTDPVDLATGKVVPVPDRTSPLPGALPLVFTRRYESVTASDATSARPGPPPSTSTWKSTPRRSCSLPRPGCCCATPFPRPVCGSCRRGARAGP